MWKGNRGRERGRPVFSLLEERRLVLRGKGKTREEGARPFLEGEGEGEGGEGKGSAAWKALLAFAAVSCSGSATAAEVVLQHHIPVFDRVVMFVEGAAANSGPFGWLILTGFIASSELLPLVPTQPFALMSGLLFGATKGAMITLLGTTTAASIAFSVSSGPIGKKMRNFAMGMEREGGEGTISSSPLMKKLVEGVEDLNLGQQMVSVMLLRFSPVVPFSISNYMLGLTPIKFVPFVAGTFLGMSPWCLMYATLGKTAGSILLQNKGESLSIDGLEELGKIVQQQIGQYSEELELLAAGTLFMLGSLVFIQSNVKINVKSK